MKKSISIKDVMKAEPSCLSENEVRKLFKGRKRLTLDDVIRLRIPFRQKKWAFSYVFCAGEARHYEYERFD